MSVREGRERLAEGGLHVERRRVRVRTQARIVVCLCAPPTLEDPTHLKAVSTVSQAHRCLTVFEI